MSAVLKSSDLYDQLIALPENLTGEIIDGKLFTQPRPAGPHAVASMGLGSGLYGAFHKGRGGPGGWWILAEPELHFIRDTEVLVPDLAGWRRERMPAIPQGHRFEVVPDWVCEILSPSTQRKDRIAKKKSYARFGVRYCWLIDPLAQTLETFELEAGQWKVVGLYQQQDVVRAAPFDDCAIELADLWVATPEREIEADSTMRE